MPVDVRESAVNPVVPERQFCVIQPEQVEDGRVDVIDLRWILSIQRLVAPLVALSVRHPPADAPATQPVGKHKRVVVPALASLRGGHSSKFRRPQNNRVLEQTTLLEVLNKRRTTARHPCGKRPVVTPEIFMRVPVAPGKSIVVPTPNLNKPDAPFQKTTRRQTLLRKVIRLFLRIDFFVPSLRSPLQPV